MAFQKGKFRSAPIIYLNLRIYRVSTKFTYSQHTIWQVLHISISQHELLKSLKPRIRSTKITYHNQEQEGAKVQKCLIMANFLDDRPKGLENSIHTSGDANPFCFRLFRAWYVHEMWLDCLYLLYSNLDLVFN